QSGEPDIAQQGVHLVFLRARQGPRENIPAVAVTQPRPGPASIRTCVMVVDWNDPVEGGGSAVISVPPGSTTQASDDPDGLASTRLRCDHPAIDADRPDNA